MINIITSIILSYFSISLVEIGNGDGSWGFINVLIGFPLFVLGNLILLIIFLARLKHYKLRIRIIGLAYYVLLIVFACILFTHPDLFDTIQPAFDIF